MARDNIKAIIEKGMKIPAAEALNMAPNNMQSKKLKKIKNEDLVEKPKMSHTVRAHRTNSPIRK